MADFNAGMSAQQRLVERLAQGAADDAADVAAFAYDAPRGDAPDVTARSVDDEDPTPELPATPYVCGDCDKSLTFAAAPNHQYECDARDGEGNYTAEWLAENGPQVGPPNYGDTA